MFIDKDIFCTKNLLLKNDLIVFETDIFIQKFSNYNIM